MALDSVAELVRRAAEDTGVVEALRNDPARLRSALNLSGAHLEALRSAAAFLPKPGIKAAKPPAPLRESIVFASATSGGTLLPPEGSGEFEIPGYTGGIPGGPAPQGPSPSPIPKGPGASPSPGVPPATPAPQAPGTFPPKGLPPVTPKSPTCVVPSLVPTAPIQAPSVPYAYPQWPVSPGQAPVWPPTWMPPSWVSPTAVLPTPGGLHTGPPQVTPSQEGPGTPSVSVTPQPPCPPAGVPMGGFPAPVHCAQHQGTHCHCAAIMGCVSLVLTTALAAITAITAIAKRR